VPQRSANPSTSAAKRSAGFYLAEFVKGLFLFWGFYGLLAAVAFGIFSRETNAYLILGLFAVFAVVIWWLLWRNRLINWTTAAFFVLSFLIAAGLFFRPVNANIPSEALALNRDVSARHADRIDYAEALFFTLAERWTSPVRQYLLEPHKVFLFKDFGYFWSRKGEYVDSNVQAQMYRHMLLASGRFGRDEVRLERHSCLNSPHTVVAIQAPDRVIHADLWAVDNFADYEFGMYTTAPCTELRGEPRR
jgi:hypothetical protein